MPAEPQQRSCSAGSTTRRPGIRSSSGRHAAGRRCACRRWQESWYATVSSSGCSSPSSASASASVTSSAGRLAVLQVRPAAGCVDDDRVDVRERVAQTLGESLGLLRAPGMRRKCAAAPLPWRDDLVPGCREHLRGGRVHLAEDDRCTQPVSRPTRPRASLLVSSRHGQACAVRRATENASVARARASAAPRRGRGAPDRVAPAAAPSACASGRAASRRARDAAVALREAAGSPARRRDASPRSAGRTGHPMGSSRGTPCSRDSGRSAPPRSG